MSKETGQYIRTMESSGFAIARSYIEPSVAEKIHASTFTPAHESMRDENGELDIVYACWDNPDVDEIVNDVTGMFHDGGYPDWSPNNITLRDTVRGFEEHADDPWFRWGSAMLYLSGVTVMRLTDSLHPEVSVTETLTPGDALFMRQAGDPPNYQGPPGLDRRTRHGANLDQVHTFGDHRSFLYVAHIDHEQAARDLRVA